MVEQESLIEEEDILDAQRIARLREIRNELRQENLGSDPTQMSFLKRGKVVEKEDFLLLEAD